MKLHKVFIVHGHDLEARDEVKRIVWEHGAEPVVLVEQRNGGDTVIEKFERHAREADFAIVILTPCDLYAQDIKDPKLDRARARQNVIFEMGWFFSRLGRDATLLVHKGNLELPSDVIGVITERFDDSPRQISHVISTALENGGVRRREHCPAK